MSKLIPSLFIVLFAYFSFAIEQKEFGIDQLQNGWNPSYDPSLHSTICTIDRVGSLSEEHFNHKYLQKLPVIFTSTQDNRKILSHTTKVIFLED